MIWGTGMLCKQYPVPRFYYGITSKKLIAMNVPSILKKNRPDFFYSKTGFMK